MDYEARIFISVTHGDRVEINRLNQASLMRLDWLKDEIHMYFIISAMMSFKKIIFVLIA
jgi:hypothetical protein